MSGHIPESLKIDVSSVKSHQELHSLLKDVFQFPDYYGKNWDAFDECIRDVELPPHIEIVGLKTLRARLPGEAELLQQCVADFVNESGHDIKFKTA
jgi:RNAse (barnase) inhibitor barstar